jgi:peptidoglycan/LPS O-acetylase OafA/YrhL
LKYRRHVDGLRAIAVTAVVLFHAFPEAVPGGFIGVDVFFVISGFLISGILFEEVLSGSFSLSRFYARRVRRIFPALAIVVWVTVAVSWFILLPAAFGQFGNQVLASALFAANFFFWFQSGYFSPDANSFPLLHLWSLGVEEQFYIVWPLLVPLLALPRRWIAAILIVGGASFALSILLAGHRELDFYLPVTRAWELMAGAALAWLDRRAPFVKAVPLPDLLVAAGLVVIVASLFLLSPKVDFPSWRAAFPVSGAMLVIAAGGHSRLAQYALSNRTAIFTGLISYPLYLWHWPILVLAASFKFMPLTLLERGLAIGASYALAAATYRYVERPIRASRPTRGQILSLASCLAATALVGAVIVRNGGFESRFPAEALFAKVGGPAAWRVNECLLDLATQTRFAGSCSEQARPLIVLWGDSTAGALMPGLRDLQSKEHFGITQLTANSCMPLLSSAVSPTCLANNERVRGLVAAARPDVVLLAGFGPLDDAIKEGWVATLAALKDVPRVVVIGPVPFWKRGLPEQAMSYYISHRHRVPERSNSQVHDLWDEHDAQSFFTRQGVKYVSAWERLCTAEGCLTRIDDRTLTAVDGVHLTAQASAFLINSIQNDLLR